VGGSSKDYMIYEVHYGFGPTNDRLFEGPKIPTQSDDFRLLKNWARYNFGFLIVPPEEEKIPEVTTTTQTGTPSSNNEESTTNKFTNLIISIFGHQFPRR